MRCFTLPDLQASGTTCVSMDNWEQIPTVSITETSDSDLSQNLRRQNSLGSGIISSRKKCVVTLDGHRYTIGKSHMYRL
ncbi:hypothetical protein Bpfe_027516 [Biomphalaria pfeifferi]|uniref:Uncharacterized protein n=1 Tax=Biomphalaria pfeifferi TaxID=112525 RepID=A0AAD8EXJ0_BIOPF|nr:hypothetical protein Bpfe_027516 [Biomphalaria pfeifferi]